MSLKALIAGAGIGGLATAAALAQRGWDVTVYERQSELRVNGSGIYLWNNGLDVLSEIGAYDRVLKTPFLGEGIEQRDHLGNVFLPAILPPGSRLVCIHRRDLHAGLEKAARDAGAEIVTGAEIVDAQSNGHLVFANGDHAVGDLLVGCDGAWSSVRRSMGVELYHQLTAEGALRTTIYATQEDFPPEARGRCIECWNGKRRLLITPVNKEEVYLALTCPETDEEARDTSIRPCWRESFPEWAFLIEKIVGPVTWNVYSVVKCKTWSVGNICILGDSAHAQPPNLGQGGGMALQNGLALAAHMANLTDGGEIPGALETWETAMRPLVDHCQYWATLYGEIANVPNELRPQALTAIMGNEWVATQIGLAATSKVVTSVDLDQIR